MAFGSLLYFGCTCTCCSKLDFFFSLIGEERRWENFLTNDIRWTKADTENVHLGVEGQMKEYISLVFISWTEGRHTGDDVWSLFSFALIALIQPNTELHWHYLSIAELLSSSSNFALSVQTYLICTMCFSTFNCHSIVTHTHCRIYCILIGWWCGVVWCGV